MSCTKCGGKGFLESSFGYGDKFRPSLKQCCDVAAYSREVQRRMSEKPESLEGGDTRPIAPVISIRRRTDEV